MWVASWWMANVSWLREISWHFAAPKALKHMFELRTDLCFLLVAQVPTSSSAPVRKHLQSPDSNFKDPLFLSLSSLWILFHI